MSGENGTFRATQVLCEQYLTSYSATGRTGVPSTRGGEMTHARDAMHQGVECIGQNESLADAALKMREMHIGALPICGDDDRLPGIITDRDIVARCVAMAAIRGR